MNQTDIIFPYACQISYIKLSAILDNSLLIKKEPDRQNPGNMKRFCDSLNHLYACVTYLAFKIPFNAKNYIGKFKQKLPGSPIMRLV